jgi:uncharacterized phiE125 gp8 family phage protein
MSLILLAGPAAEPITLAEAKAHLRVDGAAEDALIASLIITSRLHIEAALGLALITQSWSYRLDAWPKGGIVGLPIRPLQSITAVRVTDSAGTAETIEPARYLLDGASLPPRLLPAASPLPQPAVRWQGIAIDLVAGFGASAASVPAPIRQALLLLVAHWFERRDPVVEHAMTRVPDSVSDLLGPYRMPRI